jgi:hypothetical protein
MLYICTSKIYQANYQATFSSKESFPVTGKLQIEKEVNSLNTKKTVDMHSPFCKTRRNCVFLKTREFIRTLDLPEEFIINQEDLND